LIVLLAAGVAVGGCETAHPLATPVIDFARSGLVSDPKQVSRLELALTDHQIADLLDADVRAKLPTGVAVARLRSACDGFQPELETLDAREMEAWAQAVVGQDLIRGVHPISRLSHGPNRPTLHSLRTAAARMNCELLLVYLQADSSVENLNEAAVLYWTLIGLWLVPGNVYEHRTVMQAILVDCRTGMILGTATGDSHLKKSYPAAQDKIHKEKLARQGPVEALADVQKGFARLIAQTVQAALARRG
jgi:rhombotail lipoprotein